MHGRTAEGPGSGPTSQTQSSNFRLKPRCRAWEAAPSGSPALHGQLQLLTPRQQGQARSEEPPTHPDLPRLTLLSQKHSPIWPSPCTPKQSSPLGTHEAARTHSARSAHTSPGVLCQRPGGRHSTRSGVIGGQVGVPTNTHYCTCFPQRGLPATGSRVARCRYLLQNEGAPGKTGRSQRAREGHTCETPTCPAP